MDLLFDWSGISCMTTGIFLFCKKDWSKPVQQEINGTVIRTPLVFPDYAIKKFKYGNGMYFFFLHSFRTLARDCTIKLFTLANHFRSNKLVRFYVRTHLATLPILVVASCLLALLVDYSKCLHLGKLIKICLVCKCLKATNTLAYYTII